MLGSRRWTLCSLLSPILLASSLLLPAPRAAAAADACFPAATADGLPYIAPTGTGPGTGKKIGFDNTHGETAGRADWVLDGAYSDFACSLAGQGYTVEEIRSYPLILEKLNTYSAVVIPEPNVPLTTAEEKALEAYAAGGGGLLLVADHYQSDRNYNTWDASEIFNGFRRGAQKLPFSTRRFNYHGVSTNSEYLFNQGDDWLATAFGFRFRFNAIDLKPGKRFVPGDASDPGILPPSQTFGITEGVSAVATYAGSTIAIVDPARATGIIYPNRGSLKRWGSADDMDPLILYTDEIGKVAGGLPAYGGINEGAFVAVAKPGAGKVAAVGDSSIWEDASSKYVREDNGFAKNTFDHWSESGHARLALNLINWLATRDTTTGISSDFRQSATPEPYDPLNVPSWTEEPWMKGPDGYIWFDVASFKPGAYQGATPQREGTWSAPVMPANNYSNNRLAVLVSGEGLTPGQSYSTVEHFNISGGELVERRYWWGSEYSKTNEPTSRRRTGTGSTFSDDQTAQLLTADQAGKSKRWEVWDWPSGLDDQSMKFEVRVDNMVRFTQNVQQKGPGSYGFLNIQSDLGFNDGNHVAVFKTDGKVDTAVWIDPEPSVNIVLPPGVYQLDIYSGTAIEKSGITVTINRSVTTTLGQVLKDAGTGAGPAADWSFRQAPAHIYPDNRVAILLEPPNDAPRRPGGVQISLNTAASAHQAYGYWVTDHWFVLQPDPPADRDLTLELWVTGKSKDKRPARQVGTGPFGHLLISAEQGWSDGKHVALFYRAGVPDTAVPIEKTVDTTVTLSPGTYTMEVWSDTAAEVSGIPITIIADQTAGW